MQQSAQKSDASPAKQNDRTTLLIAASFCLLVFYIGAFSPPVSYLTDSELKFLEAHDTCTESNSDFDTMFYTAMLEHLKKDSTLSNECRKFYSLSEKAIKVAHQKRSYDDFIKQGIIIFIAVVLLIVSRRKLLLLAQTAKTSLCRALHSIIKIPPRKRKPLLRLVIGVALIVLGIAKAAWDQEFSLGILFGDAGMITLALIWGGLSLALYQACKMWDKFDAWLNAQN